MQRQAAALTLGDARLAKCDYATTTAATVCEFLTNARQQKLRNNYSRTQDLTTACSQLANKGHWRAMG